MRQGLIQTQSQQQTLSQTLSPQQLLQVRLLELPLNELEQRINAEMDDNPALEIGETGDDLVVEDQFSEGNSDDLGSEEDFDSQQERDERISALEIGRASCRERVLIIIKSLTATISDMKRWFMETLCRSTIN